VKLTGWSHRAHWRCEFVVSERRSRWLGLQLTQ
jgi:hypothetical protein